MGLAKKVKLDVAPFDSRGNELSTALFKQFNEWHDSDHWDKVEIEKLLLRQKEYETSQIGKRSPRPADIQIYSPSGASKCARELYFKAKKVKKEEERYPYQRRWTRNSTAVHEVTQKDLLYMTMQMKDPAFKIKLLENGLPAWEQNIKTFKRFDHNGQQFAVLGMMDGVLEYKDGSTVGFEFKTKTNSVAQVGNYKLKAPAPYHLQQCVAYSLLFGMNEFILMYEAVAKDSWMKNAEARTDIRTFYHKVTEEERIALLDRFAEVTKYIEDNKEIPPREDDKCLFCPYKYLCNAKKEGGM
ncbi:hypothetical protein vBCtySFA70_00035 [Clostridium phage vB_CtyS-FA70]|nr:hypothetical protein vBCtySFA70_00035 [Clostridium phage vB_CtyS-FA70]